MLYKNGKEFTIPKEQKDELKRLFPKFPVVLKYHKSKIIFDKDNKIHRAPDVLAIPTTASAKVGDQIDQYTYAMSARKDEKGVLRTTPRSIEVYRSVLIKEGNLDLLWYLYYCAPRIANNNVKSATPYFVFEDKAKDAQIEEDKVKKELKLKNLIYNDEIGLSVNELNEIANTFDIPFEDLSTSEIRSQLYKKIGKSDEQYQTFMERVATIKKSDSGELTENVVSKALEEKVIIYNHSKFTYHFTDPLDKDKPGAVLTSMRSIKEADAPKELAQVLARKKDVLEVLKKEMASRKENEEAPI